MRRLLFMLRFSLLSLLTLSMLGVIGAGVGYVLLAPSLPQVESLRNVDYQVPLRVLAADGSLIAEFGERRRDPMTYEELPPRLVEAFIAAEDQRFHHHPGVDYQGLARAIWYLVRTGEKGPGGSTITMQVARNFFLTREQTYLRKAREILLALKIERELTKEEILELYVNEIYLGQRAYGVGAAAQVYYGRPVGELTLAEHAMIAGLPKAPSTTNPITNPSRALERRSYVLRRMHEQGFISDAARAEALAAPVTAARHQARADVQAPWVAEMVRQELVARFGEDEAYTGGFTVRTTIDPGRQQAANDAVRQALHDYDERHGWRGALDRIDLSSVDTPVARRAALSALPRVGRLENALVLEVDGEGATLLGLEREEAWRMPFSGMSWARPFRSRDSLGPEPSGPADVLAPGDVVRVREVDGEPRLAQVPEVQGGLVALAPSDGRIEALTGGYDFSSSKFNRAVQAERQPGSSFKPFIYSAALAGDFTPATLVNDAPVVFEDVALEAAWRPENYSGRFFGPTRLREALVNSRNLVSIRVLREVGVGATMEHLRRFGFDVSRLPRNLSLSLGSGSVTPMQMARGYAVFANGGFRVTPWYIQRIEDGRGEVRYEAVPEVACAECDAESARPASADEGDAANAAVTAGVVDEPSWIPAPRAVASGNAYMMTSMLRGVVRTGTGRRAMQLGRNDLAGKTGTTNDQRDAWFVGFNDSLVASAWVGFDNLDPLGRRETGASAALPLWMAFMGPALAGVPEQRLEQPEGLVTVRIDPQSGLVTGADNPQAIFETFRADNVPRTEVASSGNADGRADSGADGAGAEESLF